MEPLNEFILFQKLPTEIRLMIWELIPWPRSIIGLQTRQDWDRARSRIGPIFLDDRGQKAGKKATYHDYALVSQPRSGRVFPLLHVNRESRGLWLPRLERIKEYRLLGVTKQCRGWMVKCNTPFVNYDADVFVLFDNMLPPLLNEARRRWKSPKRARVDVQHELGLPDPFIGFDRSRIRHVAMGDFSERSLAAVPMLDLKRLPMLESLSTITLDRYLQTNYYVGTNRAVMPALDCVLLSVTSEFLAKDPYRRLYLKRGFRTASDSKSTHDYEYTKYLEALLWHYEHETWIPRNLMGDIEDWWGFLDYIRESPPGAPQQTCPLPFKMCKKHNKSDMSKWKPGFAIKHKVLYRRPYNWTNSSVSDEDVE